MTNLRDPVRRSELCASCHIGNYSQGKVITHAMYAAGHPPLPGFEPASFGQQQPRHWKYRRETLHAPDLVNRKVNPSATDDLEQTQLVAAGGLVVLRESIRLFADQAGAAIANHEAVAWPALARFDCAACHHDLQSGGSAPWRQTRGFPGAPGRPASPAWPLALVPLALEAGDPSHAQDRTAQWNRNLDMFRTALAVQPFGEPDRIAAAARRWSAGQTTCSMICGICQ